MTRTEARMTALVLAGLLIAALSGCSQAPRAKLPGPAELAPSSDDIPASVREAAREGAEETPTPEPSQAAEPDSTEDSRHEPASKGSSSKVVVIQRAKSTSGKTLVEAAEAARESRAKAGPSVASVTNENLKDYQDAPLTFAQPEPKTAAAETSDADSAAKTTDGTGEKYWRSRVLDLRLALRGAVDQLSELQTKAAGLRRSFYAQDDPYVRDGQIKPAWDRALDQIAATRKSIYRLEDQLKETLEEGRKAGALPGWLREGLELEPSPDELPPPETRKTGEPTTYEPEEPKILDESAQPPP